MPQRRTPARQQIFRIATIVVGAAIGFAVTFGIIRSQTAGGLDVPLRFWVIGISIALGVMVASLVFGLWLGRRIVGDRIEVAFRERGQRKWRQGRIEPSASAVRLQPYAWQVRIPRGTPLELCDVRLGPDTGRRPSWKQVWSVNPQLHIVDLESTSAPLEIAALPSHLDELRDRLQVVPEAEAR